MTGTGLVLQTDSMTGNMTTSGKLLARDSRRLGDEHFTVTSLEYPVVWMALLVLPTQTA